LAKQKTACIVALPPRVIHTIDRFQPSKIKDLFVFPSFSPGHRKAVDKGNPRAVEKPGDAAVENAPVGNNGLSPHLMHGCRTPDAPVADNLFPGWST
jgi:hypothetical protein